MELKTLPFYKTHPGIYTSMGQCGEDLWLSQESALLRDLEYFSQMYPAKVKKYQVKIKDICNRFDYEGSMIYDEYPDRFSLERTAKSIAEILYREAEVEEERIDKDQEFPLIMVLLGIEVYKRRLGGRGYRFH